VFRDKRANRPIGHLSHSRLLEQHKHRILNALKQQYSALHRPRSFGALSVILVDGDLARHTREPLFVRSRALFDIYRSMVRPGSALAYSVTFAPP